jgi:hypothetical protein
MDGPGPKRINALPLLTSCVSGATWNGGNRLGRSTYRALNVEDDSGGRWGLIGGGDIEIPSIASSSELPGSSTIVSSSESSTYIGRPADALDRLVERFFPGAVCSAVKPPQRTGPQSGITYLRDVHGYDTSWLREPLLDFSGSPRPRCRTCGELANTKVTRAM